jgi:2-phospho-L-lactate guanylyltransferase
MILIPVKNLATAKQRLASLLDQSTRTELAQAMLLDVLGAVSNCCEKQAAIVTTDSHAIGLAQDFKFEIIEDNNVSETAAIELATQVCESRGIESTLVIPGDIPLITSEELDQILKAAPGEGSVLVPAADGRGTNAIFRRPAGLFPLRFGNDSFKPHLAAARATGKPCTVLSLPGIVLDIDNPCDLRAFSEASGDTHTRRLIRKWNLAALPIAANQ